jgi:putative ABC transport system permease protein
MLESLVQDGRFSLRLIARHRAFSIVALATLAVGIGAATALFSVIHAAVLRPLPYPHPEQLVDVLVTSRRPDGNDSRLAPSLVDVREWRASGRVFANLGVDRGANDLIVETPDPERVKVRAVSDGFLETLGLSPALGRAFISDDMPASSPLVVLVGHAYWRSRFAGEPAVLGRSIRVAGVPATIVGVMPRGVYPDVDLWQPYRPIPGWENRRGSGAAVIGRLLTGRTRTDAERELSSMVSVDPSASNASAEMRSLYDEAVRGTGVTLATFVAAVIAILIIACVNVAGLQLARGTLRLPELAVRKSIGADRGRIVRQLLTESLMLGVIAGSVGVLLAWWWLDALAALVHLDLPDNVALSINGEVLSFALVLVLGVSLLAGILPAFRLWGAASWQAMAGAGSRHGSALSRRGGQWLIAIEIAMAIVLVIGASLMIRSFTRLLSTDVGFDPTQVVAMEVEPIDPNPAAMKTYYPDLLDALRARLGTNDVGAASQWPFGGALLLSFLKEPKYDQSIEVRQILPGFFEAIGVSPTHGRFPTDADRRAGRPVAVINEAARAALFPDRAPVGRPLTFVSGGPIEIVGVMPDVHHDGPVWDPAPSIYLMNSEGGPERMTIFVRAAELTTPLATALRDTARSVGPAVIVDRIATGDSYLDTIVRRPRNRTWLLSLLGGIGLLLALVGVFSVTAYAVARRTQEIGVRMAFGARPNEVVRTMLRDAVTPVLGGLAIGLAASYFATAVIESFLYETTPHDPGALAAAAITLGATALVAAWIPARRAARVDPVQALRAE